jgi:hypothetical protein
MTKTVDRLGDVDPRIVASPTRAFLRPVSIEVPALMA